MILVSKHIYDKFQQYKAKQKNDASTNTNDSSEHFPLQKQLLQIMIPRSKKLGKKRNQRMLSKKIMNKPRTKKETTTPAMMGGGLTAVKMSP